MIEFYEEDGCEHLGHMMTTIVDFSWNQMEVLEGEPHAAAPLSALTREVPGYIKSSPCSREKQAFAQNYYSFTYIDV